MSEGMPNVDYRCKNRTYFDVSVKKQLFRVVFLFGSKAQGGYGSYAQR
jgi:hypothetical protein